MLQINSTTTQKPLSKFKKMSVTRKAQRSIVPYVQKSIEKVDNPIIQKGLQSAFNYFKAKSGKLNQFRVLQIDNIIQKYKQCDDAIVLGEIEECSDWLCEASKKDRPQVLGFMEAMLDAVNCSKEQYCNLYKINYYKSFSPLQKIKYKFQKNKLKETNPENKQDSFEELFYSEPRKLHNDLKKLDRSINIDSPEYKNFAKYSALKNFIFTYNLNQADATNVLYDRIYCANLDKATRNYTKKIQDNTGIKLLDYTTGVVPEKELYKVEKELEAFDKLQFDGFPLIDFLELNPIDYGFLTGAQGSYYNYNGSISQITIPEWSYHFLRHELTHAVDGNMRFAPTKLEDYTHIKKDLTKAGAPIPVIQYAKSNEAEAKAVLGEFYNKDFSQETKDFMVRTGLPEKILELKQVDFYELLTKQRTFNDKEIKVIDEIRAKFDGIIPEKVYDSILKVPVFELKQVVELTRNKNNISQKLFVEILNKMRQLGKLKSDKNYLENGIRFKREIPRGITCLDNIIKSPRQMRTLIHKYEIEIELAEIELGKLLEK